MTLHLPTGAPFSVEQQTWLDGFFAGLDLGRERYQGPAAMLTVDVLFGSQTGNASDLADQLAGGLRAAGFGANVTELDSAGVGVLTSGSSHVLIVTSTYGEGEMPDNAGMFWEDLTSTEMPRLEDLHFAVLALGDSGYDGFCQAGRDIDIRLEQLGARRLTPRVDCDVDFEDDAAEWIDAAVAAVVAAAPAGAAVPGGAGTGGSAGGAAKPEKSTWNRKNPFFSPLAATRRLSAEGSAKEIHHYEFDLGDSGITYAAGDALAVLPVNDPELVTAILARLGLEGTEAVADSTLFDVILTGREIRTPSKDLMAAIADAAPTGVLADVIRRDDRDALDSYLWGRDILDLLEENPSVRFTTDQLLDLLRPLQARQYSISSSPLASPDRIHLTVASVRHSKGAGARMLGGVCSTYLSDRIADGDLTGIWLQPNNAFSVPEDPSKPVIMVGPGTGIAPFRGFLHERAAAGATGGNWLFFGDQHEATDFIYADELTELSEQGVLTKLSLAFSRDQAEKVYVQTRMREEAEELFRWLEDGAYFYVCGDASRMAKDVETALLQVIAQQSGGSENAALEYLATLKKEKRYVRDVY
ncbi:sulfite reductase subunit alpha [Corynebacterium terpenotabidum]|uniref:assimilatory sulfite reductase (NADPH) n=1 Tax=Corynebacterium terpenotabidum Y-11 TaxID=1200352 RepID=S4XCH1_9CORY|nr:sulfite reductase subunit alpha [Corynebacterium terpenotabidum]AGP30822.1 sulfite reductase NADPH flavoprotein [Corynebacterium terpenotabidum Y-11]